MEGKNDADWSAALRWTGWSLMIVGAGALLLQCSNWLMDGYWQPLPIRTLWYEMGGHRPYFAWRGIEKIANGFLDLPLGATGLFGGCALWWWGDKIRA